MLPDHFDEMFTEFKSVVLDKLQDANTSEAELQEAAFRFLEIAKKHAQNKETNESQ